MLPSVAAIGDGAPGAEASIIAGEGQQGRDHGHHSKAALGKPRVTGVVRVQRHGVKERARQGRRADSVQDSVDDRLGHSGGHFSTALDASFEVRAWSTVFVQGKRRAPGCIAWRLQVAKASWGAAARPHRHDLRSPRTAQVVKSCGTSWYHRRIRSSRRLREPLEVPYTWSLPKHKLDYAGAEPKLGPKRRHFRAVRHFVGF